MDPSMLLIVEVAGMIVVAVLGTVLLVRADLTSVRRGAERARRIAASVPVMIFCPRAAAPASVRLGTARAASGWGLTVLECERYLEGPIGCDLECIASAEVAQPA